MSGFDTGTMQGGVFAQTKQFGSVLRGFGPPVPQAGVVGDLYVDVQTFQIFIKRSTNDTDPWGHYLFVIPATYQARLKWFVPSFPTNDIGTNGDYCMLWGGYPNYGLQPSIFGPKAAGAWPTNPAAVAVTLNPLYAAEDVNSVGLDIFPAPVVITAANYVAPADVQLIYVNFAGAVDITMGPSAVRLRVPCTVKDISGNASTNNIRIHADAADTGGIDGLNPYVINSDFGAVKLTPATLSYAVTP